jgi:hypothetical protein
MAAAKVAKPQTRPFSSVTNIFGKEKENQKWIILAGRHLHAPKVRQPRPQVGVLDRRPVCGAVGAAREEESEGGARSLRAPAGSGLSVVHPGAQAAPPSDPARRGEQKMGYQWG